MSQPQYPFYTRFGYEDYQTQFSAWISDKVILRVKTPQAWSQTATIDWEYDKFSGEKPRFSNLANPSNVDVLITYEEFMDAYNAAHEFLAMAEAKFLLTIPAAYRTAEQAKEITRLANHPLLSRRIKTRALLAVPALTEADADRYIATLTEAIADQEFIEFVRPAYIVTGEAFQVKTA